MLVLAVTSPASEFMMTMELLVYPLLTVLVLVLIFLFFGPQYWMLQRNVTHSVCITVDKCASEDCVRCNKYKAVKENACARYQTLKTLRIKAGDRLDDSLKHMRTEKVYFSDDLQQPNVLFVRNLLSQPCWPEDDFISDLTIIESKMKEIEVEYNKVYQDTWPDGWLVNTTPQGEWAVFHLINQGVRVKKNCALCPQTCAIIDSLGLAMKNNVFANVCFSVLQSGTKISPHYGPTNVRIRCHLGLKIPKSTESYMLVNGERLSWEAGKCLFFDDSYLHEVHHTSINREHRAVLLIDFWHPNLTENEKVVIDELFKYQTSELPFVRTIPIPINPDVEL